MANTQGKTVKASAKASYTMATAKADWAKIAQDEKKASTKFRERRAVVLAKLHQIDYSDTVISETFGISIGEVGKLIAAGLAKLVGGFDVLATLDAIEAKGNKVTAGKIKSLAKNSGLKKSEKSDAMASLGLDVTATRASRKASTERKETDYAEKVVGMLEQIDKWIDAGKLVGDEVADMLLYWCEQLNK